MTKLVFRFTGGWNPLSRAIQWFTFAGSDGFSHVDYVLGPSDLVGALAQRNGVVRYDGSTTSKVIHYVSIDTNPMDRDRADRWVLSQVGASYDFTAVFVGFLLRRDWADNHSKWFCSEMCFMGLVESSEGPRVPLRANRITPSMLYYLLSMKKSFLEGPSYESVT